MSSKNSAQVKKCTIDLPMGGPVALYVGSKIHNALKEVQEGMDLYHGVRFAEVLEAVYVQGLKDGRREIIEKFKTEIEQTANYLPPGQPKKKKRR